jgi:hypothetical protein
MDFGDRGSEVNNLPGGGLMLFKQDNAVAAECASVSRIDGAAPPP